MNARTKIVGIEDSPTPRALEEAIYGDILAMVKLSIPEDDDAFHPDHKQVNQAEKVAAKVGALLLFRTLNSEAAKVIKAVIACDAAERASVGGADTDYETPTTDLQEAAEGFANYTCEAVEQQMEAAR